jgi:hypothetical protein
VPLDCADALALSSGHLLLIGTAARFEAGLFLSLRRATVRGRRRVRAMRDTRRGQRAFQKALRHRNSEGRAKLTAQARKIFHEIILILVSDLNIRHLAREQERRLLKVADKETALC